MTVLWGKIIRHAVVRSNNIRFSETKWSNDVLFSSIVGFYATTVEVKANILYIVTQRAGSLTSHFCGTANEFAVRMSEALRNQNFLSEHRIEPEFIVPPQVFIYQVAENYGYKRLAKYLFSHPLFSQKNILILKVFKNKIIRKFRKILYRFFKPRYRLFCKYFWKKRYADFLYADMFGKRIDWNNPQDLNEKINWLAFCGDHKSWPMLADKYAVRDYVAERCGKEILVPLLGY